MRQADRRSPGVLHPGGRRASRRDPCGEQGGVRRRGGGVVEAGEHKRFGPDLVQVLVEVPAGEGLAAAGIPLGGRGEEPFAEAGDHRRLRLCETGCEPAGEVRRRRSRPFPRGARHGRAHAMPWDRRTGPRYRPGRAGRSAPARPPRATCRPSRRSTARRTSPLDAGSSRMSRTSPARGTRPSTARAGGPTGRGRGGRSGRAGSGSRAGNVRLPQLEVVPSELESTAVARRTVRRCDSGASLIDSPPLVERESAIDESRAEPEIGGGIQSGVELRRRSTPVSRSSSTSGRPLSGRGRLAHHFLRRSAAEALAEQERDAFREHEAAGERRGFERIRSASTTSASSVPAQQRAAPPV